ncbi:MAG: hypothetical protein JSV21_01700 [Nitrospirota bacterium]|nr:MAG: hypothetical protein JSV21_01700 [Nitrospirota bacterium]
MYWALSIKLVPGETVIEDSRDGNWAAYKPLYSVLLTDKRVILRFDSLGSSLSQSFFFNEIEEARSQKRLFINYLDIKARNKSHLFNVQRADYWAEKIMTLRDNGTASKNIEIDPGSGKKRALLHMLSALKDSSVITDEEFQEKIKKIEEITS